MARLSSVVLIIAGLCSTLAGFAQTFGNAAAGARKAAPCAGCHGIPGYRNAYPAYSVPKLGGQNPEYLVNALKAYQSGARNHSTMQASAATLSDQDMIDLAAYFSTK